MLLNKTKKYSALVETSLVKTTLCGEWENKKELRASGNNVMRNRVRRGLGVLSNYVPDIYLARSVISK